MVSIALYFLGVAPPLDFGLGFGFDFARMGQLVLVGMCHVSTA
jgi:hypothetical protein